MSLRKTLPDILQKISTKCTASVRGEVTYAETIPQVVSASQDKETLKATAMFDIINDIKILIHTGTYIINDIQTPYTDTKPHMTDLWGPTISSIF
ncbi:MAG: hypothetical protein ACI9VM_000639 [Candidatus Azotimanducaceae bacterium]|jgi:hypothetical protein